MCCVIELSIVLWYCDLWGRVMEQKQKLCGGERDFGCDQGFVPECAYPGKYPGILVGYGYLPVTRYLPELDTRCLENTQYPRVLNGYTHFLFWGTKPLSWPFLIDIKPIDDLSFLMDRCLRCVLNMAGINVRSSHVQRDWCLYPFKLPDTRQIFVG